MSWVTALYGDPCRQCGFEWDISRSEATDLVLGSVGRLSVALAGSDGRAWCDELSWNVSAYVAHVSDNLRIWAERLAGVALGAETEVPRYDNELLAIARSYPDLALQGSLWTLSRASDDWRTAVDLAADRGVEIRHPIAATCRFWT